jgi:hypothetical protein
MNEQGDLKVWWIPQIPGSPFEWPVNNFREAKLLLNVLAEYDMFQFNHNIKPDYSNAGGLMRFEDGEWMDWWDDETQDDFDEYCRNHPELDDPLGKHNQ